MLFRLYKVRDETISLRSKPLPQLNMEILKKINTKL